MTKPKSHASAMKSGLNCRWIWTGVWDGGYGSRCYALQKPNTRLKFPPIHSCPPPRGRESGKPIFALPFPLPHNFPPSSGKHVSPHLSATEAASTSSAHATAASENESMDGQLIPECPVCLHELLEPRVLHCGHNLCHDCTSDCQKTKMAGKKRVISLECPLCKRTTELRGGNK